MQNLECLTDAPHHDEVYDYLLDALEIEMRLYIFVDNVQFLVLVPEWKVCLWRSESSDLDHPDQDFK